MTEGQKERVKKLLARCEWNWNDSSDWRACPYCEAMQGMEEMGSKIIRLTGTKNHDLNARVISGCLIGFGVV